MQLRSLSHQPAYDAHGIEIFGSAQKAEEALTAATLVIARHDQIAGYPIAAETNKGPLFAFKTRETEAFPGVVIYYTISPDNDQITLWDITPHLPDDEDW